MKTYFQLFLERRNLTEEDVYKVNDGSYSLLYDIDVMANHLELIRQEQSKIVVLSDFDTDGIMSAVVGVAGLSELGFNVGVHIPQPENGYGFNESDIDAIIAAHPDVKTIITCDVGITALTGIDYALSKGLVVLVTDHHKQLDAENMHAHVVVNPMRLDETYEHPAICGAFVMWQVLAYYTQKYQSGFVNTINQLRLFAGVGTVSDMMPLRFENRVLVKDSLQLLKNIFDGFVPQGQSYLYNTSFCAMRDLLFFMQDKGKISSVDDLTPEFYGFNVAPMFNSLKRLNGDMMLAFGLFFQEGGSTEYLEELFALNEKRKRLVRNYTNKLIQEIESGQQPYEPFVYLSDAPGGILGLIATKLMGDTKLPTVVMNRESLHGSGRSPEWYPFNTRGNLHGFYVAGHEGAFGTGVQTRDELNRYVNFLRFDVPFLYREAEKNALETNSLLPMADVFDIHLSTFDRSADDCINVDALYQLLHDIDVLKPFGIGWEKPQIKISFRPSDVMIDLMGKEKQHLKIKFENGFEILMWNAADQLIPLRGASVLECIGSVDMNTFRGNTTLNIKSTVKIVA